MALAEPDDFDLDGAFGVERFDSATGFVNGIMLRDFFVDGVESEMSSVVVAGRIGRKTGRLAFGGVEENFVGFSGGVGTVVGFAGPAGARLFSSVAGKSAAVNPTVGPADASAGAGSVALDWGGDIGAGLVGVLIINGFGVFTAGGGALVGVGCGNSGDAGVLDGTVAIDGFFYGNEPEVGVGSSASDAGFIDGNVDCVNEGFGDNSASTVGEKEIHFGLNTEVDDGFI